MDGRKALEVDPRTAPVVPLAPAAQERRELPVWLAAAAGLFGPVLAELLAALEPAPAHPDAPEPLFSLVLGAVTLAAWLGAAVAGLARRPAALGWAVAVAGLTTVMVVACPSTGHHTLGGWWYGQLALCATGAAAAVAGSRWWAGRRPAA